MKEELIKWIEEKRANMAFKYYERSELPPTNKVLDLIDEIIEKIKSLN